MIMHEMVHILVDGGDLVLRCLAERRPDDEAVQYAVAHHHAEVEFMTHHLARILAPAVPLPALPRTHQEPE